MPPAGFGAMKAALLAGALTALLLGVPGLAAADPLVDILEQNVTSLSACLAGTAQGGVSVGVETGIPPKVDLGTPVITPPTPDCLVLPSPP